MSGTRDGHDVRSLSLTYYDGFHVGGHRHDWAQLIYARSGMMRVIAQGHVWFVPSTRALWIPAHTDHEFSCKGKVAFRTIYVAAERARVVTRGIGAFEVAPLLGELILHILSVEMLDPALPAQERLAGLLVDLVNAAPSVDLMLPLPSDTRAARLAAHFQDHPEDTSDLQQLAVRFAASVRTLQRCFKRETGLPIDAWRQKARLVASTASLASGRSVTDTALDCGYNSASAYIAAFKRQFGMTPRQFVRGQNSG